MATEVIFPKLGETMREGTIAEWLVQEGQQVKKGDALFQMESDKAVLDVPSPASGIVRKILAPKGKTVPILSVVAVIAGPDEDISRYEAGGPSTPAPAGATAPGAPTGVTEVSAPQAEPAPAPEASERVFASPRARRLARLEGVDIEGLTGSGPGGRIVERDVAQYLEQRPRASTAAVELARRSGVDLGSISLAPGVSRLTSAEVAAVAGAPVGPEAPAPAPTAGEEAVLERVPLSGIRGRIAAKMAESSATTAAFTLTSEVDASALVHWRERLKAAAKPGERVPTYNDLLIRLLVVALREYPRMNARLEGGELVAYGSINIGVAVDAERGLLVPVLRDAGHKSLSEIAATTADLVQRARSGDVTPDDFVGGTFTITNLGMFEIDAFTAIINIPEVAILGVGRIKERPVVRDGQVVVRPTVVLSLTVDHRLVDGAPAARFLQRLCQLIEEPLLAL